MFLAEPLNPDGSPRTYMDDETNVIKDLVDWCYGHTMELNGYSYKLNDVLNHYIVNHQEFALTLLVDLSHEQINELEKKLKDPTYSLDLGDVPTIQ